MMKLLQYCVLTGIWVPSAMAVGIVGRRSCPLRGVVVVVLLAVVAVGLSGCSTGVTVQGGPAPAQGSYTAPVDVDAAPGPKEVSSTIVAQANAPGQQAAAVPPPVAQGTSPTTVNAVATGARPEIASRTMVVQANAPGQQEPAVPPPAAQTNGASMADTIGFIQGKFDQQKETKVALVGDSGTMNLSQTISLTSACTAKSIVSFDALHAWSKGNQDLSFANIDPRDMKVVAFADWKAIYPPINNNPTNFNDEVSAQTDKNIFANQNGVSTDPPLYIVTYGELRKSSPFLGLFSDKRIAERVATAYIHAISLCHKAEAF